MLIPGWLQRQSSTVAEEISCWPMWMRKEVGLEEPRPSPAPEPDDLPPGTGAV